MTNLVLWLCALCELFLLRFFLALWKEGRRASEEREGSHQGVKKTMESGELFPMRPESRSKHTGRQRPKRAALMLTGALFVTVPLASPWHAQDTGNSTQTVPADVVKNLRL
jgi:hypothetical protein